MLLPFMLQFNTLLWTCDLWSGTEADSSQAEGCLDGRDACNTIDDEKPLLCLSNNCHSQVKSYHWKIRYKVNCTACYNFDFKWRLTRHSSNITLDPTLLQSKRNVITIDSSRLTPGKYTLKGHSSETSHAGPLTLETDFKIIPKPSGGECSIFPGSGDLQTEFSILCSGWITYSGSKLITYEVSVYWNDKDTLLLYHTPAPTQNFDLVTRLPPATAGTGYRTTILVSIFDEHSVGRDVLLSCFVRPNSLLSKTEPVFDNQLLSNGSQATITAVGVLASTLKSDVIAKNNRAIKKIKDTALFHLQAAEAHTPDELNTLLSSNKLLLNDHQNMDKESALVAGDTLNTIYDQVDDLTEQITESDEWTEIFEAFTETLALTMDALVNVGFTRRSPKEMKADSEGEEQQLGEASYDADVDVCTKMTKILETKTKLVKLIQKQSDVSEDLLQLNASGLGLTAGRKSMRDLKDSNITSTYGSVQLGHDLDADVDDDTCVDVSLITYKRNPYISENLNRTIVSAVMDFNLEGCRSESGSQRKKRQLVPRFRAGNNVTLTSVTDPDYLNSDKTDSNRLSKYLVEINQTLSLYLFVAPVSSPLAVYLRFDHRPTLSEFDYRFLVYMDKNLSKFLDHTEIPDSASKVHVGVARLIVQDLCPDPAVCEAIPLEYYFILETFRCGRVDGDHIISHELCNILKDSTRNNFNIQSYIYGAFAVEKVKEINRIDFSNVFNDFDDKVERSILVVVFVLGGIASSIVLTIIFHHFDGMDYEHWKLKQVSNNTFTAPHKYEFFVHTGEGRTAGTECDITVDFIGEDDVQSGVLKLRNTGYNFNRNAVSGFYFSSNSCLGKLKYVQVHLKSGDFIQNPAPWWLDMIVIAELDNLHWCYFPYNYFIEPDETVNIYPQSPLNSGIIHSFLWACMTKTEVSHLWFSVVWRRTRSQFTRCQRLGVCIMSVFLYMLSSAMWFDTSRTTSDKADFLNIQGIVVVAVAASIVVLIPSFVVYYLFVLSEPRRQDQNLMYISSAPTNRKTFRHSAMFVLPYWCVYAAYALIIYFILQSAGLCLLYSLQWGSDVSNYWLATTISAQLFSIFVVETVKVAFLVLLLRLYYTTDASVQHYCDLYGSINCVLAQDTEGVVKPDLSDDEKEDSQAVDTGATPKLDLPGESPNVSQLPGESPNEESTPTDESPNKEVKLPAQSPEESKLPVQSPNKETEL